MEWLIRFYEWLLMPKRKSDTWENIFLQSKVNGADYREPIGRAPTSIILPRDTWLQQRIHKVRHSKYFS